MSPSWLILVLEVSSFGFYSTGSERTGPLELMRRYVTGEVCLRGVEIVCSERLHDEFQRIRLVHVQPQNLCFAIFPRFRGYRQSGGHDEPEMDDSGSPLRIRGNGESTESRTVLWSEGTRRIGSYIIPTWQLGEQGSGAGIAAYCCRSSSRTFLAYFEPFHQFWALLRE